MAVIKPFKGIRPPENLVEKVASRPYDVLNSEEARAEAQGNPMSLYHIIKPEIDFEPGTDEHDEKVYNKAFENIKSKIGSKVDSDGNVTDAATTLEVVFEPKTNKLLGVDWLMPDNENNIDNFYEKSGYL